ncbi:hypothetical protein [Microbacterium sp. B24]|uniref:hypothetical protein n=1 Tax=Microbacterium sp. B24 TaxID=95616 RepID=UPI000412ED1C|nr:hypothetical protein [Microbacterium sp. B24]
MTIDTTPSRRAERPEEGHRPGPGADAPAAGGDEAYRLVIDDIDRYRVIADGLVIGYVDVVGAVFVALAGASYAQATEGHQALVLEDALAALMSRR